MKNIGMKHGAGGRAMRKLVEDVFLRGASDVDGVGLRALDDGAAIRFGDRWLVITTDSHVIHPIFFPGGDIGKLAVCGTVNDLAMMGATEVLGLTSSFILEDGFDLDLLERVQDSMARTARESEAPIVTGDTKVMGRGELDGIVINTTGVGLADRVISDAGLSEGDKILITGTIGDHGLAILAMRAALDLVGDLSSDVAPLGGLVRRALAAADGAITAMKDPTRGGVASALSEMAEKSGVGVVLDESALPISTAARAAAELLGIDPLHVANEGKAVLGVKPKQAAAVLRALRSHPLGADAAIIGEVTGEHCGRIVLDTGFGQRFVTEPEGEPLPRIC